MTLNHIYIYIYILSHAQIICNQASIPPSSFILFVTCDLIIKCLILEKLVQLEIDLFKTLVKLVFFFFFQVQKFIYFIVKGVVASSSSNLKFDLSSNFSQKLPSSLTTFFLVGIVARGGNLCLQVGLVLCQVMSIWLYGLTQTQPVQ